MDARAAAATITQQTSDALAGTDLGVVVDAVTVQEAGRRRLVRIFLARDLADLAPEDESSPVEPLSLDEVSATTRIVSDALDSSGLMGERPYTLEVSSTGLDRPLTSAAHFRRNVGRLVKLTLTDGTTTTERLLAAGPDGLTFAQRPQPVALSDVTKALVQVEFTRPDGKDV